MNNFNIKFNIKMEEYLDDLLYEYPNDEPSTAIYKELISSSEKTLKFFETRIPVFVDFILDNLVASILIISNGINIKLFLEAMMIPKYYKAVLEEFKKSPYESRFNKYEVIANYFPKLRDAIPLNVNSIIRSFASPNDFLKYKAFKRLKDEDLVMLFYITSEMLHITVTLEYREKYIKHLHQLLVNYYPKINNPATKIKALVTVESHDHPQLDLVCKLLYLNL